MKKLLILMALPLIGGCAMLKTTAIRQIDEQSAVYKQKYLEVPCEQGGQVWDAFVEKLKAEIMK